MAIKASGSQLAFSEIISEFGDNDTSSLGGYRIRTGGATYPQSFAGGLSFSSLDTGIPTSGEIKFSDFYSKKLNVVIDFHSGSQELGKSAKTRYNSNNVTIIGGYASRPTNTSGKKIFAYVNKTIGSPFNFSTSVVSLITGTWDAGTDLNVNLGSSGKIIGHGGDGGTGGNGGNNNGSPGVQGGSALGIQYTPTTVTNNGRIQAGFGGGGGGAGRGQTVQVGKKSSTFRTSSGGGGGGGAGVPAGTAGPAGTGANWSSGSAGTAGQEQNSVSGGAGGQNAGAGGTSGGSDNTPTSANAPNGGNSGGASGGSGGANGYAIVTTAGSGPTISGNAVVGRILTNTQPL